MIGYIVAIDEIGGSELMVYFDNSATTPPHQEVVQSFLTTSTRYFGNPSSLHKLGGEAEKLLHEAKRQVARLLHTDKPSEWILTSGGTEGNNLAIKGAVYGAKREEQHLITTTIEHPSVSETFRQLEEKGFDVTYVDVDEDGFVRPEAIEEAIRPHTTFVSVIHVNNEIGTVQPVKKIAQLCKGYRRITFHSDGVQAVGKVPIDITDLGVDLYTTSAHKFKGMKGTGMLYCKEGILLSPLFAGGQQEGTFRSGTQNVPGAVAMAKALRLVEEKRQNVYSDLHEISSYIREKLSKISDIVIHSPSKQVVPHILNFSVVGKKGEVLVHALEEADIYVSTTSACSSKKSSLSETLLAKGVSPEVAKGALRVSLSYENTLEEAQYFIEELHRVIQTVQSVKRK